MPPVPAARRLSRASGTRSKEGVRLPAPTGGGPSPVLVTRRPAWWWLDLPLPRIGANRTGRVFTGDRSAAFLVRAFHATGFANQTTSLHRGDGLRYTDLYLTAAVRCAPPGNRPTPQERDRCLPYLEREFRQLRSARAYPSPGGLRMGGHGIGRVPCSFPRASARPVRPRSLRPAGSRETSPLGLLPPEPSEHEHRETDTGHVRGSP